MKAYNAIAESLNGIIAYIPGVPYIPKIKDGKFVSGDPEAIDEDKFGKISKKDFEKAVFERRMNRMSASSRVLDENFAGTSEQRKNLENLIAREAQGQAFKSGFGGSAGLAAINRAREQGILDPARIKNLIEAFKAKEDAEEDITTLQKNITNLQRQQSRGVKKAFARLADPDSLVGFKRKDIGEVLAEAQRAVTLREQQAQKQTNIINNIQPIDASSRSTSFGGGGHPLHTGNPYVNMVTDAGGHPGLR